MVNESIEIIENTHGWFLHIAGARPVIVPIAQYALVENCLLSLLSQDNECPLHDYFTQGDYHVAATTEEAILMYCSQCPNNTVAGNS